VVLRASNKTWHDRKAAPDGRLRVLIQNGTEALRPYVEYLVAGQRATRCLDRYGTAGGSDWNHCGQIGVGDNRECRRKSME
jgi:hypothetical protein